LQLVGVAYCRMRQYAAGTEVLDRKRGSAASRKQGG
jgi:hypothetical protein